MPNDPTKLGDDLTKKIAGDISAKPQRDAVSNAATSVSDKVKSTVSGVSDAVKKGWNQFTSDIHDALDFSDKSSNPPSTPPKYHKGTDYVPRTGPAILKKGEAVLNTDDAKKYRQGKQMKASDAMSGAAEALGGKPKVPPKEIEHIKTKKAKSGGYVHEHHHTHPEHHPMETHVSADQDAMADHMMQHMGEPNPGEAEADAGQSGVPPAAAGAGAPAAGPTPGM